jgi:hypothetical protein
MLGHGSKRAEFAQELNDDMSLDLRVSSKSVVATVSDHGPW